MVGTLGRAGAVAGAQAPGHPTGARQRKVLAAGGPESARRGGQEGSCCILGSGTLPTALALAMGTPRSGGDTRTAALTQTGLAAAASWWAVPPLALQGPPESGCTPGPPTCAPAGVLLKCPPGAQPDSQHCPSPSRRRLCWATCHGSRPSGLSVPGSLKWPPAPAPLSSPGQTDPQAQRRLSVVSCPRRPWTGHLQSLDPHLPQGPEICPPTRATHSGDRVGGRGGRRPGQSAGPPGSEGKKGLVQEATARTISPRV